ncbi:MAG TPA: hypothetical protein PLI06_04225 [Methanofastidiosum sp.]|nr:hypothetical protein [Methanofastidiosum sp.]
MKKIVAIVFGLIFVLGTVGMASAATQEVIVREMCRGGPIISYGVYDAKTNQRVTVIEATGFSNLIEQIKQYEKDNGVKLFWNYYTNKKTEPGSGVFIGDCK